MQIKNMLTRNYLLIGLFLCLSFNLARAQSGFDLWAVAGINATQIEGDGLAGYDKIGLTAGLKLGFDLPENWSLNLEMLYAQKGSRASASQILAGSRQITNLTYFEIPVYVSYNDWYQKEGDYDKVGIHAGFSYGYLFSATSGNSILGDELENFKPSDFSAILGAYYAFNEKWSVTVRYTNSFIKIYKNENLTTEGLLNFLWTFRADYKF